MMSKFSLVIISTTASSKVVNHASTVNVFSCKNLHLNCPKILFHRLIGEAFVFLWNTIFSMKAMYQNGFSPLKNGKIDSRDNTDLEGNFKKIYLKIRLKSF